MAVFGAFVASRLTAVFCVVARRPICWRRPLNTGGHELRVEAVRILA